MRSDNRRTFDDDFNEVVERAPYYLRGDLTELFKRLPRERECVRWEAAGFIAQADALEQHGTPEDKEAAERTREVARFIIARASIAP